MMTVRDMIFFIKENPNTAVFFLFILVLVIYREYEKISVNKILL